MRTDIDGEALEKQPPEDEVWSVVIREKGEHPVHQVRRFLVLGERKGYQSLEPLIVIQRVKSDEPFSEDTVGVSSWRSADQIQDLRCYLLRQDSYGK